MWNAKYFAERKDIEELLTFVLSCSREELFKKDEIDDTFLPKIIRWFERLKKTEPVAYITQRAYFYGREFYVDDRVLVPRIDTEALVAKVLEFSKQLAAKAILCDVGTGSGCIGQSIFLSQDPKNLEKLFAFDISRDAIEVAQINAKKHLIENDIIFISEGFDNFETHFGTSIFSPEIDTYLITANLPYIRTIDFGGMEKSVFFHEPSVALFWGKWSGFELYERFLTILKKVKQTYPEKNLVLFMEFWYDQYEHSKVFLESMWVKFEHFKDTGNIWRIIQVTF